MEPQLTPQLHQNLKDIEVSVYNSGSDAASKKYMRLQEIVDIIITGRPLISNPHRSIKSIQDELRYRQQDLDRREYQKWKADNLPMFLVTGCFEYRNTTGLIGSHTSLISIDIDHVKDVETLKQTIIANETSLVIAGISPSGDGIKLIFQIAPTPTDAAEHKIIAVQLQQYLAKRYQLAITDGTDSAGIDSNGTKLTFTCFFFHDENLYVNTKMPTKFVGTIASNDPPTRDDKVTENFDWTKLNSCLDFYTPDCGYDDWCAIGMALKHEGTTRNNEELYYQRWYEWSAGSADKFDASAMPEKWDTFNNENQEQITLGSIYHRAIQLGWEAPQSQISERTEVYRQREAENYAEAQQFPAYLRPAPAESADLSRLLHYHSDKLLIVNDSTIYIQTRRGAWAEVSIEQSNGRIDHLLQQARTSALSEAKIKAGDEYAMRLDNSFRDANNHIKAITGRLLSIIEDGENNIDSIKDSDFNNRTTVIPTLPLHTGAIDLTTGNILSAQEYAKYHQLHTERWATDYDPDILNKNTPGTRTARYLIEQHYGKELFSRLAYHMVHPSKSVDIINMPVSSSGKTALAEWLKNTIGSVDIDSRSKSLTPRGDNYSQNTAPLTEYLFYFYDEVDKLYDDIPVGILNELTAENLTIGKKFQNPTPRTRIGTPILMGAYWPPIDAQAQGIDTRINFVYRRECGPMDTSIKLQLINDSDTHKYLLAWLVAEARRHYNSKEEWKNSTEANKARAEFIEARTPEIKKLLMDTYQQTDNSNDYVTAKHINETLSTLSDRPRNTKNIINDVFPKARDVRRTIQETPEDAPAQHRIYANLKKRVVPTDDLKEVEPSMPVNKKIQDDVNYPTMEQEIMDCLPNASTK